ncbi:MAG: glycoside hydrolase family 38 C-terminal domain-containing protein [Clostridiales bacterium]|nr:glycoside hydrolase family 38 C-terminal domain-containing protein [Clostridiales bacterium]
MAFEEYSSKIEYYIKNIPKRIYKAIGGLEYTGFFTYDRLTLAQAQSREKTPILPGFKWGRKWEYGWFFTEITVPDECKGKRVVFEAKQGESVVFVNGKIYGSFDKEHTHITLTDCSKGGERFKIAMEAYAGHDGLENTLDREHTKLVLSQEDLKEFPEDTEQKTVKSGSFGMFYDEVFRLWMDINTLYDLRNNLDDNSLRKAKIEKALSKMCDAVDIELPFEDFLLSVKEGRKILKSVLDCKNGSTAPTVYAIGHSHLDLQWLWTKNETRRKIARTLGNQLKLMEEYEEYKYIQSQPWLLEVVKNEYPDLYKDLKQAVRDGKITVEGGTWVEPDTNIPSGESLIRQFMFGKRFIKEEFDTESEIFWLPDSFGMSGSLPQIMKGCGIKYFMNAKIMWQYTGGDEVPHSNFMWQGIDGSEILTNLTQEYVVDMTPSKIFEKWHMNKEKADVPITLVSYGHGDGGGGATKIHLEYLKRESNLEGMPKVVSESPVKFFQALESDCEINERYVGELYYAAHRGTYTSQAKTKKLNRQSEFALRDAELWSALLKKDTKAETDALWKTVLFNQFHDIIPGTSIAPVHEQAEKEYEEVIRQANELSASAVENVIRDKNECLTVFNSLSWDRKAYIELPEGYSSAENCETQRIGDKVIALVDVPACGFKSYKLGRDFAEEGKADEALTLENNLIKAEFNRNGELISVSDKQTGTEYLSQPSNVFRMYQNKPTVFDAWDIDSFYEKTELHLENKTEIYVEYKGKLESSLVIKKKLNNSSLVQRVILRKDSRRIDFETEIDWRETHKLLKVDFNTDIQTDELISEVQFGYVKRPNHKTRQYDADRFEVCNHKWSALCESKRGAAILNDCKYGISADKGRMSLTLLNSSVHPGLNADKGIQSFKYSFMTFAENLADSDVTKEAFELNSHVMIKDGFAGEKSLLNVSESNIIIDTIKAAEDGSGDIIIRMYESSNTRTNCTLTCAFNINEAYITNMLEQNSVKAEVKNNELAFAFRPFEVVTVRLKMQY